MQVLLIFIKNPRLGYVKTRLAATVGDAAALEIYHELMERTRQAALNIVDIDRWLYYSDQVERRDSWPDTFFDKKVQQAGDLGHRMRSAFEAAFASGADRAVIIGSDCPALSGEVLQNAFKALDNHDLVVGPTFDGGYYLLGLKNLQVDVFSEMIWSTDTVCAETVSRANAAGAKTFLLPQLSDIDEEADWIRWKSTQ